MAYKIKENGQPYWEPNSKPQREFLSLPDTINQALYGGAAGGGKTEALLMYPIINRWHENSHFHGIIFRRTYPEIEESLVIESQKLYPNVGGVYNANKHYWQFPSGAIIRFGHLQYEKDVYNHQSAAFAYIAFDELTHFTEFMFKYMMSRLRVAKYSGLVPVNRNGSNPGNVGHSWVRKLFIEPNLNGYEIINSVDTDGNNYLRIFIPARATDNPDINESYLQELRNLPEADRKALMDGDWWAYAGQVFTELRTLHYPGEPENALHVIEPFEIPTWWPKLLTVDWGYSAMAYMSWAALSPELRLIIYREYGVRRKPIAEWGANAAKLSQYDGEIKIVTIDPSARKHDVSEQSILDQWIHYSGFKQTEPGDNDRIGGKQLIHDFLRWQPKPAKKIPVMGYSHDEFERIYRNYGEQAAKEYQLMFLPEQAEKNIPYLQIFNTCPLLIQALQSCSYEDTGKDGKKPEDIKEFDGDDPIDTLRYKLKRAHRLYYETKNRAEEFQTKSEIINAYNKTGDYSSFHRRMDLFESQHSKSKAILGPSLRRWKRKSKHRIVLGQ